MKAPQPSTAAAPATAAATAAWASSVRLWFWGGLAFVAAAIALLESLDPYFFCQDDALVLELPLVLQSCRGLWEAMPPTYNPYTFLGEPTHAAGSNYPPLHAAYAVARFIVGDECATFEVSAAMHLAAGYCVAYLAARRMGVGAALSSLASVTFVLSGPVLVMTRCWHAFAAPAVFIPLFAMLADRLRQGPVDWRWPVATGLALGLFYHAGFPQLFVLGGGFLILHAASLGAWKLVPYRRLLWFVPALAWGASAAMPVFYQQWRLSREMTGDDAGGGSGVGGNLLSMLLPYPLTIGTLPNGWGNVNLQWNGHFYYFGTVLLLAFCAAVAAAAWRCIRTGAKGVAGTCSSRLQWSLAIPALVALLLSLGDVGGLWWLMDYFPVGLRNNPFRAMPWFVFFACVCGARFLQEAIDSPPSPSRWHALWRWPRIEAAVAGTGFTLVGLHVTRVSIAFFVYGFVPYPQLPEELLGVIGGDTQGHQQRIMTFAAMRTPDSSYPLALPHNLPCVYEVPAVFGYNPLVERFGRYRSCVDRITEQPRKALSAYGVRWLLIHRTTWGGWRPQTPNSFERVVPFLDLFVALDEHPVDDRMLDLPGLEEYLRVVELPNAAPLAFDAGRPTEALPLHMSTSGLAIQLVPGPEPRKIVANFLAYPDIVATADGRPAVVSEDEWQRIVVAAPAGAKDIAIRYAPPRGPGIAIAAVLAIVGAAATAACRWARA